MWILYITLIFGGFSILDTHYVCVRPTIPSGVGSPEDSDGCYTLGEWVENGTSRLFTNDTTVTFMDGVHLIDGATATDRILIKNVHLLFIAGKQDKGVTISCSNDFSIEFETFKNVTISNITFDSCGLVVSDIIHDISFVNVLVLKAGLTIYQYSTKLKEYNNRIFHGDKRPCAIQGTVHIIESTFINSNVRMGIGNTAAVNLEKLNLVASCAQLNVSSVIIKDRESKKTEITLLINDAFRVFLFNVTISNNVSPQGGISINSVYFVYFNRVRFWQNTSPMLSLKKVEEVTFEGPISFMWNRGSGMVLESVTEIRMTQNVDIYNNYVENDLLLISESRLNIVSGTLTIENNSITSENGGILVLDSLESQAKLVVSTSMLILRNNTSSQSESRGAILLIMHSTVAFQYGSHVEFARNSGHLSGGIVLLSSKIVIEDTNATFEYNEGEDGGAMAFYQGSYITTTGSGEKESILNFRKNKARKRGGAIFVEDTDYVESLASVPYKYFLREPLLLFGRKNTQQLKLNFSQNIAELAGNDVYGGWIDSYYINYWKSITLQIQSSDDDINAVTSNPTRICMCINSVPDCNITNYETELFPGETFEVEVVAVGQRRGVVPSIVVAEFTEGEGTFKEEQVVQNVRRKCTLLNYTIHSKRKFEIVELKPETNGVPQSNYLDEWLPLKYHQIFRQFSIDIALKECQLGFRFENRTKSCSCLPSIEQHAGVNCDYNTFSILRTGSKWLMATSVHTISHEVIVHDHCPYDYCGIDTHSLSFHLEFPDNQCAFNRSGVLCGQCQTNLSQVFGTSRCVECSSIMLLAIIPGVAIAGVVLVLFLMLFNLTVAVGTIGGLVFYANIIRAAHSVFFPPEINTSFLSIFVAWLNLDLGIETCFYSSLDAYTKTWLQFAFPLYIWLLVIAIIVASHYSTIVSKFTPNNAVQVLATLFLLSYAKILRVVITVFSSTVLIYPDGFKKRVWLYDGNVDFLRGKHISLFVATLFLLILLSVPYTVSLLSIQWLQRISHYRLLFWVHRLMPLFDAYTGPYKHQHRCWTGLLLLARVLFLTVFTLNIDNDPSINLLAITVITFSLQMYLSFVGVYKNWLNNVLEITSLMNAGFLSVSCLYLLLNNRTQVVATTISTSIAFVIFSLIVLSQAVQKLLSNRKIRDLKSSVTLDNFASIRVRQRNKSTLDSADKLETNATKNTLTHTSIELSELLLQESN